MEQAENAIAQNLKAIREGRNLSLDQLSELTGVSKSMLRQIETGRSSPTISTIWKIANGLRLSFTTLLSKRSAEVAIRDFKGQQPLTAESDQYRVFPLIPFDPEHSFEFYYVEIDPGTTFSGEPHQGNVEEVLFIIGGTLEITVDDDRYTVSKDRSVRFLADRPHTYHSSGDEMVRAIMMICYLS